MAMLPYGTWWRRHRRTFNEHFHASTIWKYQPMQAREVRAFLNRLLTTPDNFCTIFDTTIMNVAYGIKVKDADDPYILNAEEALHGLAEAGIPGTFLVDFLPFLKYVPNWFPSVEDKWYVCAISILLYDTPMYHNPAEKGTALPCLASTLIEMLPEEGDPSRGEERKTVSAVQCFFLAMSMYPEVQKKAQAEIDAFSDRHALPYINALIKESMRWQSIIPLAVGHMATEDDEYDGYFIPKGTVVLGNGSLRIPTRTLPKDGQLDPDVRQPDTGAFGFGRRMCPGRHFSDNSLYAIVSSVLAPVKLKAEVTSGFCRNYPVPFKCDIKPRSRAAEALIHDSVVEDN
ncbi:cytochrome P450 [Pholiota molesta]|nr:cytochrome P450 [Pholiota molesta]